MTQESSVPEPLSRAELGAQLVDLIPALRAFARSFCPRPDDADDLVQETLIKGWSHLDQYTPGTNMKSWLFTIMRNAFYTRIVKQNRERPGLFDCVADMPSRDPTQEWSARGLEIADAIERLPVHQREIIMLVGVMGTSYEDAAVICGCAVGTIKSRVNRARQRLLEELGETSFRGSVELMTSYPVGSLPAPAISPKP